MTLSTKNIHISAKQNVMYENICRVGKQHMLLAHRTGYRRITEDEQSTWCCKSYAACPPYGCINGSQGIEQPTRHDSKTKCDLALGIEMEIPDRVCMLCRDKACLVCTQKNKM